MKRKEEITSVMEYLTVKQVAEDIGCNPQNLREQIRKDPKAVGFPVCVIGSRTYIPKEGYERWKKYGN